MIFNDAQVSMSCLVATEPVSGMTRTGIPTARMRIAWTPRRRDRVTGEWTDERTSFATVLMYRGLAENANTCVRKGDAVVVHGDLSVREWEGKDGAKRQEVEITASHVGPNLSRGIAKFKRLRAGTDQPAVSDSEDPAASDLPEFVTAGVRAGSEGDEGDDLYDAREIDDAEAGEVRADEVGADSKPDLVATPF